MIGGVLLLLLIVAGALFFMSPSKPSGNNQTGPVTLTWWKTFEETSTVQELLTEYQTLNPNVTINFVKKDIVDYEKELLNAFASGTPPDIFSIHNDWLPAHADRIAPMPSGTMTLRNYRDTFIDVASNDFVKDNQIYAVPLATDVLALYYNKDLLGSVGISEPPSTWPELVAMVSRLTKVGESGSFDRSAVAMGTSSNVNRAVDILSLLMLQNGTQFYSEGFASASFGQAQSTPGGEGSNYNPGEVALAFYNQFANPSKTTYTWNSRSDFNLDAFTQGKLSMMISYAYIQPMLRSRAPNLNWDVTQIPQVSDDAIKVNFANYWGETVAKSSPNANIAWNFLNYMTQKQTLDKYYTKRKQVASRKDMLPSQFADTDIGVFAEGAITARSVYKKDSSVFEAVFAKMIDDVVLRNFTPTQAISNAVQQINLNLQK